MTAYDNVVAQHRLVTEHFGIETLVLVTGWSMGALQTYHWGALYPDMVPRILPFQGSAKCSRHNFVFLEGAKAALQADAAFAEGWYTSPPNKGLRAFGRVYAGWGLSQTFYRIEADLTHMGYASLEDFLVGFWEGLFYTRDANDLLAMLWTWQNGDIGANPVFKGDTKAALAAIRAKAILMPASTDPVLPAGGQPDRGGIDAERRVAGDRDMVGPFRRRSRHQPRRHRHARRRAQRAARELNAGPRRQGRRRPSSTARRMSRPAQTGRTPRSRQRESNNDG